MYLHVQLLVSKLVHFVHVVGQVALEQGFHDGVLRFCPTSVIVPMPHTPISFIYYTCFIEKEVASTLNKIPVFINQELCIFLWCLLLCMNLTRNINYSCKC